MLRGGGKKRSSTVGPDHIPVETWKNHGEVALNCLTSRLLNRILEAKSVGKTVSYKFKKCDDVKSCSNYKES